MSAPEAKKDPTNPAEFLAVLGLDEPPMAIFYTDAEPQEGLTPEADDLPTREKEAANQVDWGRVFGHFSCVIGHIWRARRKKTTAYFDAQRFGCVGGAFFMGRMKPQTEAIIHYVSSGVPGHMEGERYIESPEKLRTIFDYLDPRPAPARYCVVKPVDQLAPGERAEVVAFFARPEVLSGLHQLAAFVTNDPEVVQSPWGAACANLITWPLHYLARGQEKAVLGGWDPSARKYFKTDELSLSVPLALYDKMLARWPESFLATHAWQTTRKKIERSKKAWGEKTA